MTGLAAARLRYEQLARRFFLPLVLVVFTASGFAGLIYESIWSHYLKQFLGHAAYAQTLVLAIFMGGMALGAWAASRLSRRWKDLLLVYALIEAAIGVASLVFHDVFVALTAVAFDTVIPALGSPVAIHAFKWTLAAALILPQSVLLGMTFPLMTGGVLRLRPERSGYVIAMLYFTNSLGAGVGVLASGFYLIGAVGLPGTLAAAAVINLAVAAAVMLLPRGGAPAAAAPAAPAGVAPAAAAVPLRRLLLAVAALTGMSSFMYEIGWIRMLALVLGSSTHAFELMLSAFILGIAFGGAWVRRRIDAAADSVRLLGYVQLAMGIAALATLPVYGSTFEFMQYAMQSLTPTETAYFAFNLVSHGICLAVMFPAAFCAGMTLPLITATLLRSGAGERAIGQVYAANTAGAIAGVLVAVHLGFPLLGLKGLIVAGAAIDLALGLVLLGAGQRGWRRPYASALACAGALAVALFGVELQAHDMSSSVFRTGELLRKDGPERVVMQLDGKTATISLTRAPDLLALRTNGKSDGAIRWTPGAPNVDEVTMVLIGALPHFLAPQARQIANIGFGTGLTTHTLLAADRVETVDTVEIEPAILRVAHHFRPFNARALDDPRGRVHYEDAKTYFASRQARYDVIVSEPSNPWVSGVSSLFSTEFYRDVRRHLRDGGLFLQWIQIYEMAPSLFATVVAALDENFTDYEFWQANEGDVIIVASHKGRLAPADARGFDNPMLRQDLERFNIRNLDDLLLHRVGGRAALRPYFAAYGVQANSDFYPVLDLKAPVARFMRLRVDDLNQLMESGLPLLELFERPRVRQADPMRLSPGERGDLRRLPLARQAASASAYLRDGRSAVPSGDVSAGLSDDLVLLRAALIECRVALPPATIRSLSTDVARLINQHVARREREAVWRRMTTSPCHARLGPMERQFLRLHAAIAAESPERIVDAAGPLLDAGDLPRRFVPYALAAHMTGLILSNQGLAAIRSFNKHRGALASAPAWQPVFRFLVAQTSVPRP